jgi:hypothetical protein
MGLSCIRAYYSASISEFLGESDRSILGTLSDANLFDLTQAQKKAWKEQIRILRHSLGRIDGAVAFEFSIPRMGSRIDVVVIAESIAFIIEFKIGAQSFDSHAIDQVTDYALDLHYFHEPSHSCKLVPILVASSASDAAHTVWREQTDSLLSPAECATPNGLGRLIAQYAGSVGGKKIDAEAWLNGRYSPTPTIVEAASALYRGHSVQEISRSDAAGESLVQTSDAIARVIEESRAGSRKSICFVTGVPGAGKTLVGLNVANQHTDKENELYSVFLSGNGPLVAVLREALARNKVAQEKFRNKKITKKEASSQVKQFIQNVHHFRDSCLDDEKPPIERVALFDEAQRAWNLAQTADFMSRKKNRPDFRQSEPEFLISCLDRHSEWATIVCLVGGGQEINRGEGGIREWFEALRAFPHWNIHLAPELKYAEFDPGPALHAFELEGRVQTDKALHLFASMRAFRAERVSELVRSLLEFDLELAQAAFRACSSNYPILLTRNIETARDWLRTRARGTERTGIVVSSAAERLRPLAINVRAPIDPINWFLGPKEDVRSSYYLEDVATEFHIQGLELDWTCVTWDADFRYSIAGWQHFDFVGTNWNRVRSEDRRRYQKNAYRVLLTRARQGMIILVPKGDERDPTRSPELYNPTFEYLKGIGFPVI